MNKKWYTGISVAFLLCLFGALSYTTTVEAKKTNQDFENLTKCASEKNPKYLLGVITGAMDAYGKDVEKALKERSEKKGLKLLKKHRKPIIRTIDFLFHDSKHFKHAFMHEAHNPRFEKVLNEHVQKMYHVEYHAAHKHKKEQKAITKEYKAIVKEFKKRGVKKISKITPPKGKEGMSFKQRISEGASSFVDKVKNRKKKHKKKRSARSDDDDSDDDDSDEEGDDDSDDDDSDEEGDDDSDDDDSDEEGDDDSDDDDSEEEGDDDSDDDDSDEEGDDDSDEEGDDDSDDDDSGDDYDSDDDSDDDDSDEEGDDDSDDEEEEE